MDAREGIPQGETSHMKVNIILDSQIHSPGDQENEERRKIGPIAVVNDDGRLRRLGSVRGLGPIAGGTHLHDGLVNISPCEIKNQNAPCRIRRLVRHLMGVELSDSLKIPREFYVRR